MLSPQKAKQAIINQIKRGKQTLPIMLEGRPGVGKTAVVYDAAKELGARIIEFRPCMHGVEDLIGLPKFNDDGTSTFASPDWLPRDEELTIMLIDEFPQAMPAMQNALSQLLWGGRLHDYVKPDNTFLVLTGNRAEDQASTFRSPSHIKERRIPITVDFILDDWVDWALANNINDGIIAFAKFRPALLDEFDPNEDCYCTPRSLSLCSDYVDEQDYIIRKAMFEGLIGKGPAAELLAFLKVWEHLPSVEQVIKAPATIPAPTEPDVRFAITEALSAASNKANVSKIIEFMSRLPEEYQVAYFKGTIKRVPSILTEAGFKTFLAKFKDLIQ